MTEHDYTVVLRWDVALNKLNCSKTLTVSKQLDKDEHSLGSNSLKNGEKTLKCTIKLFICKVVVYMNLRDKDAFICGIKGVSCMTLSPSTNTDAKFLPWLLLDHNFLQ